MTRDRSPVAGGQLALQFPVPVSVPAQPGRLVRDVGLSGPRPARSSFAARLEGSWLWDTQVRQVLAEVPALAARMADQPVRVSLVRADPDSDLNRATDYLAVYEYPASLGLRVRSWEHLARFGGEFVLRDSAPAGQRTEAEKILNDESTAQFYLYAFADPTRTRFLQWTLVHCTVLRRWWGTPHLRESLQARPVNFAPGQRGLAFPIPALQRAGAVIRALLVTPTYYNVDAVKAQLSGNPVFEGLDPWKQHDLAMLFLRGSFQSTFYIGPDPATSR